MEKADIYVCTSNKLEGWGAVIYEGLSAGCATIATSAAGATPFLIKDGETGYAYRSGDWRSLADKLELYLKDVEGAHLMGRRAYELRDGMFLGIFTHIKAYELNAKLTCQHLAHLCLTHTCRPHEE